MERLIQRINKDISIFFDSGSFDDWCVYIRDSNGKRAPLDIEYFDFFVNLLKVIPHFLVAFERCNTAIFFW